MAKYTACENALLVHYSTDYVFDGRKAGAYVEEDAPNPQSVYGATKLAGEHAIRQQGGKALVFRTSWVFSFYGANFVKTIVRLAQERDHLDIISDQVGAPTSAELIADITALALSANRCGALPFGVYHLCAGGEASWYDFARYIVTELWARKTLLKLTVAGIRPIDTESYPLPAKRPKNSRLNTNKLGNALGLEKMPDWTLYVDRTLDQLI
jgi:dTDP-4-dehydrorhamnose reductase